MGGGKGAALTNTDAQQSPERDETQSEQEPDSGNRESQVEEEDLADGQPEPPNQTQPGPEQVAKNSPATQTTPVLPAELKELQKSPRATFKGFFSPFELPPSSSEEKEVLGVVLDANPGDLEIRFPDLEKILGKKFKFKRLEEGTADSDPKVWQIVRTVDPVGVPEKDVPIGEVQARSTGKDCEIIFSWRDDDPNYEQYKQAIRYGRMELECTRDINLDEDRIPKTIRFDHPPPQREIRTKTLDFQDSSIHLADFKLPEGLKTDAIYWDYLGGPSELVPKSRAEVPLDEKLVLKDSKGYVAIELSIKQIGDPNRYECRAEVFEILHPEESPRGQEDKREWPIDRSQLGSKLEELGKLNKGRLGRKNNKDLDQFDKANKAFEEAHEQATQLAKEIDELEKEIKSKKVDMHNAKRPVKADIQADIDRLEGKQKQKKKDKSGLGLRTLQNVLNTKKERFENTKRQLDELNAIPRLREVQKILSDLSGETIHFRIVLRLQDGSPVPLVESPAGGGGSQ